MFRCHRNHLVTVLCLLLVRGVTLDAHRCCSVASHNMLHVPLNLYQRRAFSAVLLFSIIKEMLSSFDKTANIAASKPPALSTRYRSFTFCLDQTLLSLPPPSLQIKRFGRARCSLNEKNSDDKFSSFGCLARLPIPDLSQQELTSEMYVIQQWSPNT